MHGFAHGFRFPYNVLEVRSIPARQSSSHHHRPKIHFKFPPRESDQLFATQDNAALSKSQLYFEIIELLQYYNTIISKLQIVHSIMIGVDESGILSR